MGEELAQTFRLSNEPGSLGLSCDEEDGLALAGIPLLQRTERGWAPRPRPEIHQLISQAYDIEADVTSVMNGLNVVARALNEGDMPRTMIAAVQLKLPELDWDGAVRIAQTENTLSKYDENEPRDWRGRWTCGDDSRLKLPPGERIDELGDLLEWIANANPEDEQAIRREIKRLYHDVGDTQGGNALNLALSRALNAGSNKQTREGILEEFEPYTRSDPAEAAQFTRDLTTLGLLFPLSIARAPAEAEVADEAGEASDVWKMGWGARGEAIDEALGGNLPPKFPVIDRFADGVATSIKSIDLTSGIYQSAKRLLWRINTYVDQVAGFNGDRWGGMEIQPGEITGRALNLAIPRGSTTAEQQMVIAAAKARARNLGVNLIVTPF